MKEKYFSPQEVNLGYSTSGISFFKKIFEHEICGLLKMGSVLQEDNISILNSTDTSSGFYNRIYPKYIEDIPNRDFTGSIIINPIWCKDTEELIVELRKKDFQHTISSKVYGSPLSLININKNITDCKDIEIKKVPFPNSDEYICFKRLFQSFFLKNGETAEQLNERLQNNLEKGPHMVAFTKNNYSPIGCIGSIIIDGTCSVYALKIEEKFSSLLNILYLRSKFIIYLKEQSNVDFIYLKTRNKAVSLIVEKFQPNFYLYSEHVYNG